MAGKVIAHLVGWYIPNGQPNANGMDGLTIDGGYLLEAQRMHAELEHRARGQPLAVEIDIKPVRDKRTLDQNRLMWALLNRLALALSGDIPGGVTAEECYLDLLAEFGAEVETWRVPVKALPALRGAYRVVQLVELLDNGQCMAESGGKTAEAFATVDNTTEAAKEKLITSAQNVAITFGDMLIPVIKDIIGYAQQIVDWLNSLDEGQKQTIIQVLAVVAALSPALLVFGKVVTVTGNIVSGVGMVIKIAGSLVGFVTGTAVPGITSALTTLFAFLAANPVIAIILAITAAIIALVALVGTKGDEIQALLQKVDDFLQAVFATDWTNVFGPVLGTALNLFFANVKNVWDHVKQVLDGIIDFIRGVFTGDWERAWTGVKEIFAGIFDGLKAAAKAPLNAIIRLVNAAISGINGVIHTVNKLPGVNIGEIGQIPYLAKGGILSRGSAVVGEAGPELLTINQGRAVVQPLTNNSTTNNANYGGVTVNVYAAAGQDVNELAEAVVYKIQHAVDQTGAVWA